MAGTNKLFKVFAIVLLLGVLLFAVDAASKKHLKTKTAPKKILHHLLYSDDDDLMLGDEPESSGDGPDGPDNEGSATPTVKPKPPANELDPDFSIDGLPDINELLPGNNMNWPTFKPAIRPTAKPPCHLTNSCPPVKPPCQSGQPCPPVKPPCQSGQPCPPPQSPCHSGRPCPPVQPPAPPPCSPAKPCPPVQPPAPPCHSARPCPPVQPPAPPPCSPSRPCPPVQPPAPPPCPPAKPCPPVQPPAPPPCHSARPCPPVQPPAPPPCSPSKPCPPVQPPAPPPCPPAKPCPPVQPPAPPPCSPTKPCPPVQPPAPPPCHSGKPCPPVQPPCNAGKPCPPVKPPCQPNRPCNQVSLPPVYSPANVCGKTYFCRKGYSGPCHRNEIFTSSPSYLSRPVSSGRSTCPNYFSPPAGCFSSTNNPFALTGKSSPGYCTIRYAHQPCYGYPSTYRYCKQTKQCYPTTPTSLYDPRPPQGPCPADQYFAIADKYYGYCRCNRPNYVHCPQTKRCYPAYTKGSCTAGQWLVPHGNVGLATCKACPCPSLADGHHMYWSGKGHQHGRPGCYKSQTRGPCQHGMRFVVDDILTGSAHCVRNHSRRPSSSYNSLWNDWNLFYGNSNF
ncbi:uncharacterized protein LOC130703586 [Daphnia carinata]|uniref:uncharacterized protein LOC130703586 n=1 Tax=Daphnia carinata TaxID=120202 RepID=UPI00257F329F|nr:uncharacterized protein LOC130703586 [Daphnia carinata]